MLRLISDPEHSYSVQIPNVTPQGKPVEVTKREHAGVHQLHAQSPDFQELYFEVRSYVGVVDHEKAIAEEKAFLAEHSPDGQSTDAQATVFRELAATTFSFVGTLVGVWKERCFLYIDSANRSYRIVYDPRSELNEQVLASLVIET